MTNPAAPQGVADDQCLMFPWRFSVLKSTDRGDSRRRWCSVGALDNDLLGLNIPSDKRTLLPIDRNTDPTTNPAEPQGVADDQRPSCPGRFSVLKPTNLGHNRCRSCSQGA